MGKKTVKSKPATNGAKTFVLFGLDEQGKPRAARLTEHNESLVSRAAQAMALRVGVATGSEHSAILSKIPHGRLFSTGKGAVPNVSTELYAQLNKLVGGDPGPVSVTLPKSWSDICAGQLVLAQESVSGGWWEAIVVKRNADSLTLRWRDYPSQDVVVRALLNVALLNADAA